MFIGPKLNKSTQYNEVLGEDQLGIKYVAINMSDELQTGITSVTQRARYWSFYTWVLYDFIYNSNLIKTENNLKEYIKRQEWYFILGNIAYGRKMGEEPTSLQGVRVGNHVWNDNPNAQFFELNDKYISNSYGGYSVYRNALKILGLTCDADQGNNIQIDCVTKTGEQVALAFKEEIKDTEYYKLYRLSGMSVPKKVLLQYGEKVRLSHIGQTKDGQKLIEIFLPSDSSNELANRRTTSLQYYRYILNNQKVQSLSEKGWRHIFYDIFSTRVNPSVLIPDEFKQVALGWEICTTRMYFTYALEGMWARALIKMEKMPLNMNTLIEEILNEVDKKVLKKNVSLFIGSKILSEKEREKTRAHLVDINDLATLSALQLLFDVYNRLINRDDFDEFHLDLLLFGEIDQLSLQHWINIVTDYKDRTIENFLKYILQNLILNQHLKKALDKLCTTKNKTFHFTQEGGLLHLVALDHPEFNVLRVVQGTSVLRDLDLI